MKRLARNAFTLCAGLSLLLCIALLLAWAASLHHSWVTKSGRLMLLSVDRHELRFGTYASIPKVGDRFGITQDWTVGPVQFKRTPGVNPPNSRLECSVALWLLLPAAAVLPVAWTLMWRRQRQRRRQAAQGLCRACGYDLRASPERCPECGTSIVSRC